MAHPTNSNPPTDWKSVVSGVLANEERVVFCGIGNDLRGDDGAGVFFLRALKVKAAKKKSSPDSKNRPVLFIECGKAPENQTGRIRAFQPDVVILIDAARGGRKPGEIFLVEKEMISDEEVSTHRISLSILIQFIVESIGARVVFLGIEPVSTGIKDRLSLPVRKAISGLVNYLNARL